MYSNITDSLNALAKKIKADPNGKDIESALSNISVKLGGKKSVGNTVAHAIDNITEVVDIDTMHNMTQLSVTPTTSAQTITPEAPIDGYDTVNVSAVTAAIDSNITAGNIKKDVQILGVTGSYEGSGGETFEVTITAQGEPGSYTLSANKTYLETMAAINNGDAITFTLVIGEETMNALGYFTMHTTTDDDAIAVVVQAEDASLKIVEFVKWYSDNTFELTMYTPANA